MAKRAGEGFVAGSPRGGGDSAGGRESPARAEGGGRRGGTGLGVTRRPAGRNLRDLRVAAALPGRAQGGGPGPRGRARGEPEPGPAGRPRGNRGWGRAGGGGGAEPGGHGGTAGARDEAPGWTCVLPKLLSKENVCRALP